MEVLTYFCLCGGSEDGDDDGSGGDCGGELQSGN